MAVVIIVLNFARHCCVPFFIKKTPVKPYGRKLLLIFFKNQIT